MDYDITIVSGAEDFYLADALCREMEKSGKRCLFNWRNEKKPLKPMAKFVGNSPIFCMLFNSDTIKNLHFKALGKMNSEKKAVDVVLLITDGCTSIPSDWGYVRTLDASRGLTPNIINGVLNGVSEVVCDIPADIPADLAAEDGAKSKSQYYYERVIDTAKVEELAVVDDSAPNTLKRAVHYIVGDTVPKDDGRALKLVVKALEEDLGDIQTNFIAGLCYEFGVGDRSSGFLAPAYYAVAMKGGHPGATMRCAMANIKDDEYEKAKEIIHDKAKEGDKDASFMMGVICEADGNFDDAMEFYFTAAEAGDARSQNSLGCLYAEGKGTEQNTETALNWFGLAATQGLAAAHCNMAAILMADSPRSNTFEEGVSHLKEAASAGHADAIDILKELERQEQIHKNAEARKQAEVRRKQEEAARRAQGWEDFKRGLNANGILNDALNLFK